MLSWTSTSSSSSNARSDVPSKRRIGAARSKSHLNGAKNLEIEECGNEKEHGKSSPHLYAVVRMLLIVLICFLLWILFGRVYAYIFPSVSSDIPNRGRDPRQTVDLSVLENRRALSQSKISSSTSSKPSTGVDGSAQEVRVMKIQIADREEQQVALTVAKMDEALLNEQIPISQANEYANKQDEEEYENKLSANGELQSYSESVSSGELTSDSDDFHPLVLAAELSQNSPNIRQSVSPSDLFSDSSSFRDGSNNFFTSAQIAQNVLGIPMNALQQEQSLYEKNIHSSDNFTDVIAFYYDWYGNPTIDKHYIHWDYPVQPAPPVTSTSGDDVFDFDLDEHLQISGKSFNLGDDDASSVAYPKLGLYSSADRKIIEAHFDAIKHSGVNVIAVNFFGFNRSDAASLYAAHGDLHALNALQARHLTTTLPLLFDVAQTKNISICVHFMSHIHRNAATIRSDLALFLSRFQSHPALYRFSSASASPAFRHLHGLPLVFFQKIHLIAPEHWKEILAEKHVLAIGQIRGQKDQAKIFEGGFDGFYLLPPASFSLFASSSSSSSSLLSSLHKFSQSYSLLFYPVVCPGFADTRIRPWNKARSKPRDRGRFYEKQWKEIIGVKAERLAIASWNDWHSGTQIEPNVVKKTKHGYQFMDYGEPNYYLYLTKVFISRYYRIHADQTHMHDPKD